MGLTIPYVRLRILTTYKNYPTTICVFKIFINSTHRKKKKKKRRKVMSINSRDFSLTVTILSYFAFGTLIYIDHLTISPRDYVTTISNQHH